MATQSPLNSPSDYEDRLAAACWPLPMTYFRALKSMFYSGVMLAGMWLVLEADVGQTTAIAVFAGFVTFLIIYATETRELEIASGLASASLTFFNTDRTDDDDDPDP